MSNQDNPQIVIGQGVLCMSRLFIVGGSGTNGEEQEGQVPEDDDEDLSADNDDADQQRILKQLNFPPRS